VAENTAGKSVYGKTCAMCHAAGVAGAPKPGDKEDWGPRIAQGKDTLYKHAIEGFTGAKGMMPARGGASSLSDDDVKAAVDFMADQSM
jgi:cytochrome c5